VVDVDVDKCSFAVLGAVSGGEEVSSRGRICPNVGIGCLGTMRPLRIM